jgi:hypothetical protein
MAFITLSSLFMTQRTASLYAKCSPPGGHGACFARPDVRLCVAILNLIQIKNPAAKLAALRNRQVKEASLS